MDVRATGERVIADSTTTRYQLVKPEVGASSDTWGAKWNTNADDEDALLGAITTTGSADAYILTTSLSLAAYVAGQTFWIKANFTNSGASTVAVDGLAAKAIRKNGVTALAAGDITSGNVYAISYDASNDWFQLVAGGGFQPLDATLTALAALSWSSGNALVQFTAADTVSLTLTPSVNTVTATTTVAATHAVTAKNTTDNANVAALRIEGDRATPAAQDVVYASFYLSDSAGNQDEFVRFTARGQAVTSGAEDAQMRIGTVTGGALADRLGLNSVALFPTTNDGLTLGNSSFSWADLFLASGGAINANNSNAVISHVTGGFETTTGGFAGRAIQVASVGGETLAAATHRQRMLLLDGDITIDDGIFTAGDYGMLIGDGTNRTVTRAAGCTLYVNGVDSATATIPAHTVAGYVAETAAIIHLTGSAF